MAADTVHSIDHPAVERPKVSDREPLHEGYLRDGEIWRQNKMWDRFDRLRKEDPVHYTPDSFVGPYWSVTKYEDIMAVDTDHKRFSSSWEHGGITLGEPLEDFEMPMFIAMD